MTHHTMPLGETAQFSPIFLDYLNNTPELQPFFGLYPSLGNFAAQIEAKAFSASHREILVETLNRQYASLDNKPNLAMLREANTYTVTTGHQLNLYNGPLYVLYKMITTVKLAKVLKGRYPQYNFVPMYWMATEDHDLEEINHFHLFGKKYQWETSQKGAVGRMNPKDMKAFIQALPEKVSLFEEAYLKHDTLADATRCYAHELFGSEGLVCVDADDPALKALFKSVMRDDLTNHSASAIVKETSRQLEELGYKTQVNAREINFFYLDAHLRERIVFEGGKYHVLNTNLTFTEQELLDLIEQSPEKFSPNVILRPLYQETILPNLAYIGGPAEVVYWLQLKALFDHYQTPFPIVMPRNFALVINKTHAKKMQKLSLSNADLFQEEALLKRQFVERNTDAVSLEEENNLLDKAFDSVLAKALKLDKTLEGFVLAEKQKVLKSLENIDKRLKRAEEQTQETGINQLLALKAKLFPNGGLQERTDNYLNFALNNPAFIREVAAAFDPLDFQFHILTESD